MADEPNTSTNAPSSPMAGQPAPAAGVPQSRRQAQPKRSESPRGPEPEESTDNIAALIALSHQSKVQRPPQDIHAAGISWNTWEVVAGRGDKLSDALSPRYLWNKHEQIQAGDTIHIKHPQMLWLLTLHVVRVDEVARGLVCHIGNLQDFSRAEYMIVPLLSNAKVDWLGDRGWAVIDGGHVAKDGFHNQAAAEDWLRERISMAA